MLGFAKYHRREERSLLELYEVASLPNVDFILFLLLPATSPFHLWCSVGFV